MIRVCDDDDDGDDDETTMVRMTSRRRPALQEVPFRREERTVLVQSVNSKFPFAVRLSVDSTSLCFQ